MKPNRSAVRGLPLPAFTVFVLSISPLCLSADSPAKELPAKRIGHASRELLIAGWDADAVKKHFGAPAEVRKEKFAQPKYRAPNPPPAADEQWIYSAFASMGHRLIYFHRGRVVLAIEEWSDF